MIRTTLVGLMLVAATAMAQPPDPGRGPGRFGPGPGFPVRLLGGEAGMPGPTVKNAPYTADVVTEVTQALPDGNHIHQINTMHVARDSEGRTRREESLHNLNGLAANANLPQMVFINDPVAGVNYALNPTEKTANRSTWSGRGGPGGGGRAMMRQSGDAPPPPPRQVTVDGQVVRRGRNQNVKTEALGRQSIEGVPADGTRTTMTIPAGQIGNDQPIQVVTETWYSQDLHTVVLSKRTDPRTGETVSRMANVSRAEPPHSLFEVPSDFKVTEGRRPGRGPQQ